MKCILDNIIFALQRSGGASVVWSEHIKRLLNEKDCNPYFIDFKTSFNNIFRKELNIPEKQVLFNSDNLMFIKRYINLNTKEKNKFIFHSSHYRIDKNKYALNITTVHDFTYEKYVTGIRRYVHCKQKYNAILNSDAIICVSESTKKDLLHYLPYIQENKIHVIYNGVNNCFKVENPINFSLDIPFSDKSYILYVGVRGPRYKNFSIVVDLCSEIKLPLIIVGGEQINDTEKGLLDIKLGKNYYKHFRGLSSNLLNELYNRALVFIYPSLYEGFGIPVIEAQKAGCPVIAFNNSSIPEVMGKSEFLLENNSFYALKNAVNEIKNNHLIREEEILRGLENSKRFSWDLTYKNTYNLYSNLYNQ
ncbi:glycosyltransferase family 1 protein [uncultured Bacteroides sp.]|uniref:glycosyltransferase family 4 protein n=1 Tax=uncultured Bacteroides sp. TaxID=162156 RepID=UPI002596EF40|nr:glycosyltransferase family 1 protein [uncultured Bacteroides sp.]